MPWKKKTYTKKKKPYTSYKKKYMKKSYVSKSVKNYVKKQIHRNEENKQFTENQGPTALNFSTSGTIPLAYDITPALSYGTANGFRIGNRVRVLRASLNVNLFKSQAATGAGDVPSRVQFIIAKVIEAPTATPSSGDYDKLFWVDGGATDTFESGATNMFQRPFNKEYWDVRYRSPIFKIGNATGSSASISSNPGYNNDFYLVRDWKVSLNKIFPKIIKFDSANSGSTNCNWFVIFFIQKIDFTTSTTGWSAPGATVLTNFLYEDA